jgi:hypothetical protein
MLVQVVVLSLSADPLALMRVATPQLAAMGLDAIGVCENPLSSYENVPAHKTR